MSKDETERQKLIRLRKLLIDSFNLEELRILCFDLDFDYEELAGTTKTTRIHDFIMHLKRHGKLQQLLDEVSKQRPHVDWPDLEPETAVPTTSDGYTDEKTGLVMIRVPAGSYLYGEDKQPSFLPEFWIAKTPVTDAHYARFTAATGHDRERIWVPGKEDHPVCSISWDDAVAYAKWAGMQLPTEEQWEKAARGTDGREYPWGNEWQQYCNTMEAGIIDTTPVGYYSPFGDSPYGCVDMSGNVWEWTNSWYGDAYIWRTLRGGSRLDEQESARVAFRSGHLPTIQLPTNGFRVVSASSSISKLP
jgi:hypothetical protein